MLDLLIIADRDLDHAQSTLLAIRNAGFDHPIFYVRSSAALIARLSAPASKGPRPSSVLIDIGLLRECGPELMRCLRQPDAPHIELTALLSSERERFQLEQCGFRQIGYLVRPVKPVDVLGLLGLRAASRTPPAGHPRLLWPASPDRITHAAVAASSHPT